jgi:MFS family permease
VEALIYDTLPVEPGNQPARDAAMKRAMGLVGFAYQLAFFLAPISGSFLIPVYTMARFLLIVLLTACSVGVALLVAFTLEEPAQPYQHGEQSPLLTLRKGVTQLRRTPRLQWLLLIAVLTATFSMILVGLYQPYFSQVGILAFGMGWAFAIGALVAGLGERYVYKVEQWLGPRLGLWTVTILPGLCYLGFALVSSAPLIFLLFVLTYGTTTLKNPLLSAYQNALIVPQQRATVLSLISLCTSFYVALLSLVVGWLADIDLRYGFALIGLIIVVATLVLRVDRVGALVDEG